MTSIEIAGKSYNLKDSITGKPYLSLGVFEDFVHLSQEIVRISTDQKELAPWERRQIIQPLWERICRLFFDDIEGLSVDEIDEIDMEDLNRFFGEVVAQKKRMRRDGNVTYLNSLIEKAQSQNSPQSTT